MRMIASAGLSTEVTFLVERDPRELTAQGRQLASDLSPFAYRNATAGNLLAAQGHGVAIALVRILHDRIPAEWWLHSSVVGSDLSAQRVIDN